MIFDMHCPLIGLILYSLWHWEWLESNKAFHNSYSIYCLWFKKHCHCYWLGIHSYPLGWRNSYPNIPLWLSIHPKALGMNNCLAIAYGIFIWLCHIYILLAFGWINSSFHILWVDDSRAFDSRILHPSIPRLWVYGNICCWLFCFGIHRWNHCHCSYLV